ncbi:MAG: OmpA family protein [Cyclobacteriaceae bacterium]|nr:OmpA family protein [Cyclobacteriaceae bacterium]
MNDHSTSTFSIIIARLIICVSVALPATLAHAQNYSFEHAKKLNESVNSESEESMPVMAPNGKKLYFVRTFFEQNTGGKLSGQDIWVSEKNELNEWGPATNALQNLNNHRNNAVIGIKADETAIYLLNSYKPNTTKINGIAKSIKIGEDWSKPYDIKINGLESDNSFIGFYISPKEDVLIISMNGSNSIGEEDLYISLKDEKGQWSKPENMGATINTKGFEISPFLSDDGNTLFFASDGHSGYGGADIFMSRKLYDSWLLWSKPINLGEEVNSPGFDAYLRLYKDQEAYFVSTRSGNFADIYTTKVTAIEDRKENAEISKTKHKLTETEIQELLGMPVSRTVYFDFESYDVAPSSRELIYFLANKLVSNLQYSIELVGHTSNEGTEDYNLELSERRAEEVGSYFSDFGILPGRISTKGVGESKPIVTSGSEEELAKNRRVEIYFVK